MFIGDMNQLFSSTCSGKVIDSLLKSQQSYKSLIQYLSSYKYPQCLIGKGSSILVVRHVTLSHLPTNNQLQYTF